MSLLTLFVLLVALAAAPLEAVQAPDVLGTEEIIRIGVGETTFSGPGQVVVAPGSGDIFVVDPVVGREIRVLGPDGEVRRTIGRSGRGPGEFSRAPVIGVANDTLLAIEPGRLHVFSVDGTAVRTVRLEGDILRGIPVSLSYSAGTWLGHFAGVWQTDAGEAYQHRLYAIDSTTGAAESLIEIPQGASSGPFFTPPPTALSGSHLVTASGDDYAIAFVSPDGTRTERSFDVPPRVLEDADLDAYQDRQTERCDASSDTTRCRQGLDETLREARASLGDQLRPVGNLAPADDGCVLVKRRDLDPDLFRATPGEPFDLVCAGSATRAAVTFPTSFTPVWIVDSVAYGWESGQFDVPILVGYRLTG